MNKVLSRIPQNTKTLILEHSENGSGINPIAEKKSKEFLKL